MNKLVINKKFFEKLDNENNKKVLKIYGYYSKEDFIQQVINELNTEYNFLRVEGYEFLTEEEEKEYFEYNGYIKGKYDDYDLVTVSFTTIVGKSGNVFLNQQVVPMITAKINKNKDFLINERIKRICLLTTHKSKIMDPSKNKVDENSAMQMSIKFANTIGFEFIEFFPIEGINIKSNYKSIEEIVEHSEYLKSLKLTNSQFEQIKIIDDIVYARFEKEPVGQEPKFFALKVYAIIALNTEYAIILDETLNQTEDVTIKVLNEYLKYVSNSEIKAKISKAKEYYLEDEVIEVDDDVSPTEIMIGESDEYKLVPETRYDSRGKKIYITRRRYKIESFENHNYYCACHDEKHYYFTSSATHKQYVEGHHMIPMENQHQYWKESKTNLDCAINIVPLCPHCHNKIHKAIPNEKIEIITNIFYKYKKELTKLDRNITLQSFASLYNVYFV